MRTNSLVVVVALTVGLPGVAGTPADEQAVKDAINALNAAFEKGDAAAIKRLVTADHVAVTGYYGGPQTRDEQLASLKDLKLTEYKAGTLKVTALGKDAALVTYLLMLRGTYKGQAVPAQNFASAVWVRRDGRWQEAFYQETPVAAK